MIMYLLQHCTFLRPELCIPFLYVIRKFIHRLCGLIPFIQVQLINYKMKIKLAEKMSTFGEIRLQPEMNNLIRFAMKIIISCSNKPPMPLW